VSTRADLCPSDARNVENAFPVQPSPSSSTLLLKEHYQ
jgi:hypothetical protein